MQKVDQMKPLPYIVTSAYISHDKLVVRPELPWLLATRVCRIKRRWRFISALDAWFVSKKNPFSKCCIPHAPPVFIILTVALRDQPWKCFVHTPEPASRYPSELWLASLGDSASHIAPPNANIQCRCWKHSGRDAARQKANVRRLRLTDEWATWLNLRECCSRDSLTDPWITVIYWKMFRL